MLLRALLLVPLLVAACSPKGTTNAPAPTTPADDSSAEPAPLPPDEPATDRTSLSAKECEDQGGTVVGDIGDGAIHRPDYVCPDSGKPPLGNIAADPGGPMGVEGAVCCV